MSLLPAIFFSSHRWAVFCLLPLHGRLGFLWCSVIHAQALVVKLGAISPVVVSSSSVPSPLVPKDVAPRCAILQFPLDTVLPARSSAGSQ